MQVRAILLAATLVTLTTIGVDVARADITIAGAGPMSVTLTIGQ
jgi:hypothetical protein